MIANAWNNIWTNANISVSFFFFFKVHGHPLVLFIFIQSGYLLLCCTMNSTVDKKHCGSQSAKFHRRNHVSYTAYTQANHTSACTSQPHARSLINS